MTTDSSFGRLWIAATGPELACAPGFEGNLREETWPCTRAEGTAYLVTGCGPGLASAGLAWFLGRYRVREIVGIGIAGCYPGSGLRLGGVHRVVSERCVDLGAERGDAAIAPLPFEGLRCEEFLLHQPTDLQSLPPARGLTVASATGTASTALRRRAAGADLESMEGAAWAEVAARFGVPFAQVRAVSNVAGPRDPAAWRIPEALQALQRALSKDGP